MTLDGWISVTDRLPPEDRLVLAYVPDGYPENAIVVGKVYVYPNGRGESVIWVACGEWCGDTATPVTHWRELPDPPGQVLCPDCHGEGRYKWYGPGPFSEDPPKGIRRRWRPCDLCGGTGKVSCCDGSGLVSETASAPEDL